MKYIDLHCDTLMGAFFAKKTDLGRMEKASIDLERLKKGDCMAQFFAIFLPSLTMREKMDSKLPDDETYIRELHTIFCNTLEKYPEDISFAGNATQLAENHRAGKVSAFLTIEDGRSVNGDMANLERYYNMGVRLISLTWNHANCFGFPNSTDPEIMGRGLTEFGKDAVVRMNELGMLVDVSHLSDGGFWDVAEISRKPFVASHSNCRALGAHQRNLTDEMIRALADRGGVAGINFASQFLTKDVNYHVSRISDLVAHACHLKNKGGIECVALGTDFDGISCELEVTGPDQMYLLFDAMKKAGFTEGEIEKIAYQNAQRVIADVL